MVKQFFITFLVLVAFVDVISSKVVTYPAGKDVELIKDFTVRVRQLGGEWLPIDIYPVKVDEVRGTKHRIETASMAYFDFDGTVEVEVTSNKGNVETARVRPLSYDIDTNISGNKVFFTLDKPSNLSVEVNGDLFHNLHLFANPIDINRPTEREIKRAGKKNSNLIYFAPGLHKLPGDTLRIPSGKTVYVDGGARVIGTFILRDVNDVKIFGRGEVHPKGRGAGVSLIKARNVEVEGIVVTQLPVGESDSVKITNVKGITSYGWGDGFNVFSSSNVKYDRIFARTSDDCTTVYATRLGHKGSSRNILMENSTLWADVAHPINIGLHGNAERPDTIENITYRNIEDKKKKEPQLDCQGVFAIVAGDDNLVRNVTFDNIRVEDIRQGRLFDIRVALIEKYCAVPGRAIEDIYFKDIFYNGKNAEVSIILGYNEERKVKNITFDNLVINGKKIYDDMPDKPKWYKTGDMGRIFIGEHVENVVFK